MIKIDVFRQLTKFTYILEKMRQDNLIRRIQTTDQVQVLPGENEIGWMRWDDQIRN